MLEERCSQCILIAPRADRIKSHCREYIPGRCLAVVFIAAIPVGRCFVESVHYFGNPILRLPRLSRPVVEIEHVLYRLVAMGILTEVHNLHLSDFMNHTTIITIVEVGS